MKTIVLQLLLAISTMCFGVRAGAQVAAMNSLPSAAATVFLDFDGHLVDGTSWNYTGPIACGSSNLAASQVTEIFHRVAEDFRPFNLNITTDSARYWSAPLTQRVRIILTITSDWYGPAGGVSYYGSFTWGDNTPAFVFTALLNYNTKFIAEAASHEIGHTMNLRHQTVFDSSCNLASAYHAGTGSGEIGWAPIMGVGYYRNQSVWNNGTDPYGCNSIQNDLEILTTTNGFGFRSDDNNGSFGGNGTQLSFSNNTFNYNGIIERGTDADVIRFTMPANGRFILNALPGSIGAGNNGANLDIRIDLMTSSNNVLRTYNPTSLLDAAIDTMLNSGNYFLRIRGTGNEFTPQYASLGSYSLTGRFSNEVVLPLRKLELQGRKAGGAHQLNWVIDADEQVVEQVVEQSKDGRTFTPLAAIAFSQRTFTSAATQGTTLYRLKVRFDNGRTHYSNTIAIREANQAAPYLLGNGIHQQLGINSSNTYQYRVVDFNGRTMASGTVQKGTNWIAAANWPTGFYLLQLTTNDEQHSLKFMKQ